MRVFAILAALSAAGSDAASGQVRTLPNGGTIHAQTSPYRTSKEARDHLEPAPTSCFDDANKNLCSVVFVPIGGPRKTGWVAMWAKGLHTVCFDEATAEHRVDCSAADAVASLDVSLNICSPDWDRLPTAEELTALYPAGARDKNMAGRVRLQCVVHADGALEGCQVIDEQPANAGFGAAALKATQYFRMRPQTPAGKPSAGAIVIVPIRWPVDPERLQSVCQRPMPND